MLQVTRLGVRIGFHPQESDAGSFDVSAQLQSDFSLLRERKSVFNVDA